MDNKKVIIIGGGFAGIAVAKKLAKANCQITIIDKTNHHLFQPLLYQVATAALSPGDIATPIRAIFSKQKNISVVLGEVLDIDKDEQTIRLRNGTTFTFDELIIATGAEYNYFGNTDWEEFAPGLKTVANALEIRERILFSLEKAEHISDPEKRKPYLTYVVIGGGPTGVEMAGSIAEIAKRSMMQDYRNIDPEETSIHLIEAADGILNGFEEPLPNKALHTLREMGVEVHLDTPVQKIQADGVQVKGQFIQTPNIIWGAGVKASPLISKLNIETDRIGRAKVRDDLSIPGYDHIYVAGDAAYVEDKMGNPLPGIAPVALQQGKYLGSMIRSEFAVSDRKPFSYIDKGTMATIGRAKAIADIKGLKFSGFFAWLLWGLIHIFFLIGFRNRFRVFAEWMWHYLTFKRGVRLISKRESEE